MWALLLKPSVFLEDLALKERILIVLSRKLGASVVLECVLAPVAAVATSALRIPTIGIGAGPFCSGQAIHDGFKLFLGLRPKFKRERESIRETKHQWSRVLLNDEASGSRGGGGGSVKIGGGGGGGGMKRGHRQRW
ncbi:hypothetical protein HYC85_029282 [Camellia sinensis]|uniref:3-methyl-2-oxobutanoate hydroxymethyltransferase n=1 Tax=Camellia sinensis TaxID=4442 RepID=A0A7J7FYT1_CAMSI|nr:hypothetical protein HYC85_029282 [Camellia sinensis]